MKKFLSVDGSLAAAMLFAGCNRDKEKSLRNRMFIQ